MSGIKGTFSQEILRKLILGGTIFIAAQSPYLWLNVYKGLFKESKFKERKVRDVFYYLNKRGLIKVEKINKQIYISLTKEGEKEAGKFQINKLKIRSSKKWDRKWRIIIFDIPEATRIKRDAFRGKLKEFGFYQLQKSVWVYPYPCQREIELLREFFNLSSRNLRILEVEKIEEDNLLRKVFGLS